MLCHRQGLVSFTVAYFSNSCDFYQSLDLKDNLYFKGISTGSSVQ